MNLVSLLKNVIEQFPLAAVLVVFALGFLASLSSCTLIRLPVVFGYVSSAAHSRKHSFLLALCFSLGLIVSYVFMGMLFMSLKDFSVRLAQVSRYIYLVLGTVLLGAGLLYAGLIQIKDLGAQRCSAHKTHSKAGFFRTFIFGASFAFLEMPACPCCASGLFVIVGFLTLCGSGFYAFAILLSFAVGQSLPILLIGASVGKVKALAEKVAHAEQYIQLGTGTLLIVVALYFFVIA